MATVPMVFGVGLGSANTGRAATVQYKITDNGNTIRQAFTNTGVSEDADDAGYYLTSSINVDLAWSFPLRINWKDTGIATLGATEFISLTSAIGGLALPAIAAGASGGLATTTSAVGSVTGAVGSVTGNVGGNVTGSVGSVTGTTGDLATISTMSTRVLLGVPAVAPGNSGGLPIIGESNQLLDAADLVAVANALLTAAISPTSRPTIGTVAEALAAARAAAIGNKTRAGGGNVVVLKASDDSTNFSTLSFDNVSSPTTETRS